MHADNWANKAKQMGYRTRAVFKLEEILNKIKPKKKYKNVLDIGSAPGGWSQFIKKKYSNTNVYALDILDMEPIDGVNFYKDSICLLYTSPSPRDGLLSRMPSSA